MVLIRNLVTTGVHLHREPAVEGEDYSDAAPPPPPTLGPVPQPEVHMFSLLVAGSVADPRNFGTDPDPRIRTYDLCMDMDSDPDADLDPAIFVSGLQDVSFFAYYFLKLHLHYFQR
jgi:hypothetical protein